MKKKEIIETAIQSMIVSNSVDIASGKLPTMPSMQMVKLVTFSEKNGIGIGSTYVPKIDNVVDQIRNQVNNTGEEVMAISIITFDGQFKSEVIRYNDEPQRVSEVQANRQTFSLN